MLSTPGSGVLSTMMWSNYENGDLSAAAVIGVILVLAAGTFAALGRWAMSRRRT
jgi:ABC-type sulfate transport system permease component